MQKPKVYSIYECTNRIPLIYALLAYLYQKFDIHVTWHNAQIAGNGKIILNSHKMNDSFVAHSQHTSI